MVLTSEEIEAAKTESGGLTRDTLARWGVPWPPPKGWRKQLEGRDGKEHPNAIRKNWRNDNITPAQFWKLTKEFGYDETEILGWTKGIAHDAIAEEMSGHPLEVREVPPPMCSGDWTDDDPIGNCGNCVNCTKSQLDREFLEITRSF